MNDATRILAEFKRALDEHFGLNPVKPEHRPSQDTLNRFAELTREEDWKQKIEDELQSLNRRMTGRHIYAIELNPAYVDVAVKRWQDFTGKEAVHEEMSLTFADMANIRYDANANSAGSYNDAIAALKEKVEASAG